MNKGKKNGKLGIIITIVVLTLLVLITNLDVSKFSYVEGITNKLVMPIQNGLTYLKNKVAKNSTFFDDINNLKQENKDLKEQNQELLKQVSEMGTIKAENDTLREYANLSDKYTKYTTVPAYIIDRDLSNFSSTIVINIGKKDGININMAVVASEGVVGHIISVTETTAKVQPIIDPASSTSAVMNISRDNVIVKGELGSSDKLKATYISADAKLVLNDEVETSGLGGIYPKGLKIGKLVEIVEQQNVTEKYGIIEAAVDFSKLENVLVIVEDK